MTRAFSYIRNFFAEDAAQDAFEYLLIIGVVSVVVVAAMATPVGTNLLNAVVAGVCSAINGMPGGMSCTLPLP